MSKIAKIYNDRREKQKAYRERKKKRGNRLVTLYVPEHIYPFIKGRPEILIDAFIDRHKDDFVEFNTVSLGKENTSPIVLSNAKGESWIITNGSDIQSIKENLGSKMTLLKLYPDGRLQIGKKCIALAKSSKSQEHDGTKG